MRLDDMIFYESEKHDVKRGEGVIEEDSERTLNVRVVSRIRQ